MNSESAQPTPQQASQHSTRDSIQDSTQPISQPVSEPIPQPISQPVSELIPQPISQPVSELIPQPIPQPVSEPIPQPISQPVSESIPQFIPLRVHSHFSLTDSIIRLTPKSQQSLIDSLSKQGYLACGLTDAMNAFGLLGFYRNCLKQGIKPIIGADITIKTPRGLVIMPLFAMNKKGYTNLCKLLSKAWLEQRVNIKKGGQKPYLHLEQLKGLSDNLIAFCGGARGIIAPFLLSKKNIPTQAQKEQVIRPLLDLFGDRFYLEIHRLGFIEEEQWIETAIELAQTYNIPLVATNLTLFIEKQGFEAHEARVCINRSLTIDSGELEGEFSPEQYLKSPAEMQQLFADIPSALENTVIVAQRCNLELELNIPKLPNFDIATNETLEEYFNNKSHEGLKKRLEVFNIDKLQHPIYLRRLETEIKVIQEMNYIGYFLIVEDFIAWAKNNDIPVGPGRGSGAGSLVAYALEITDVDPIEFNLIFERFLNQERNTMPDFDIDFCAEKRNEVIRYVEQKYGQSQVAQIITFGKLSAKSVVRDVARIQGLPYSVGEHVAKLVPAELDITLTKAMAESSEFRRAYQQDEEVRGIIDLSMQLEGVIRNVGTHAGGVVIAPSNITDFCPLYKDDIESDNFPVTHFDKDDLETAGLVKFDFLGVKVLTGIQHTIRLANQMRDPEQPEIHLDQVDFNNEKVFDLLSSGKVSGVFQLESAGMRKYIQKLKPKLFEDIVALLALYRPGPLGQGMVDTFIDRKHGKEKIQVLHIDMEKILDETHGVIVYQEQIMQIAQRLALFTMGSADKLRQAMGKKDEQKMLAMKKLFISGCIKNNIHSRLAEKIASLMEEFARYGFNKSHSVAYAFLTYYGAWLKVSYPLAFFSAIMSNDMANHASLLEYKEDAKEFNIDVLSVDINHSEYFFTPIKENNIIYWALGSLKGVGRANCEQIVAARKKQGEFTSFFDFCVKANAHKLGKRTLEALIYAGAFEKLGVSRNILLNNTRIGVALSKKVFEERRTGQRDLFNKNPKNVIFPDYLAALPLSAIELIENEKKYMGDYREIGPAQLYHREFKHYGIHTIKQINQWINVLSQAGKSYDKPTPRSFIGEIAKIHFNEKGSKAPEWKNKKQDSEKSKKTENSKKSKKTNTPLKTEQPILSSLSIAESELPHFSTSPPTLTSTSVSPESFTTPQHLDEQNQPAQENLNNTEETQEAQETPNETDTKTNNQDNSEANPPPNNSNSSNNSENSKEKPKEDNSENEKKVIRTHKENSYELVFANRTENIRGLLTDPNLVEYIRANKALKEGQTVLVKGIYEYNRFFQRKAFHIQEFLTFERLRKENLISLTITTTLEKMEVISATFKKVFKLRELQHEQQHEQQQQISKTKDNSHPATIQIPFKIHIKTDYDQLQAGVKCNSKGEIVADNLLILELNHLSLKEPDIEVSYNTYYN